VTAAEAEAARTLRAVTSCASVADFVAVFAPFVNETSVFVVTPEPLPAGTERQFVFQLADGTAALQGRGRVVDSAGDRPMGRAGMRIELIELTPRSRDVHRALVVAQKASTTHRHPNTVPREPPPAPLPPRLPEVRRLPSPSTPPPGPWEDVPTRPGGPNELAALVAADLPPVVVDEDRAPASPDTLPANPLAEVSDDALATFVDYTLLEDSGPFPLPREAALAPGPRRAIARAAALVRRPVTLGHLLAVAAAALLVGVVAGRGLASDPPVAHRAARRPAPAMTTALPVAGPPATTPPDAAATAPAPETAAPVSVEGDATPRSRDSRAKPARRRRAR